MRISYVTIVVSSACLVVAPLAGRGEASEAHGVWAPSHDNFSKWAGLRPEENAARAELATLQARLQEAALTGRARWAAEREVQAARAALERLVDAPWSARAALEAEVRARAFVVRARLDGAGDVLGAPTRSAAIAGPVWYPGCAPPRDLVVCAASAPDEAPIACARPERDGGRIEYHLEVPPGTYVVFAERRRSQDDFRAFYSRAVPCGLRVECTDHRPIVLELEPGEVASGVAPADWFRGRSRARHAER